MTAKFYNSIKRVLTILIVVFITVSCNNSNDEPEPEPDINHPDPILLAYYDLNDNAIDETGNGNNGQMFNTPATTDRHRDPNGALEFNREDSKVILTRNIDDSLAVGVTFSAWIYYTGTQYGRILSNYNGQAVGYGCGDRVGFVFGVTPDNRLNMFYAVDSDDYIGRKTIQDIIPENEWTHVCGLWNGTLYSNGFRLYVNGQRVDYYDESSGNVSCGFYESLNPFYIGMGHCKNGQCHPFKGKIDDVRIYSSIISEDSIKQLAKY